MKPDRKVIQSYVWRGSKVYFVSTIERDSSSLVVFERYNETMAWELDPKTLEKGDLVAEGSNARDYIREHLRFCEELHKYGYVRDEDEQ